MSRPNRLRHATIELQRRGETGVLKLIRELLLSKYLDLYHIQRYRHRYSVEGDPLYYFAVGGKKNADIPASLVESLDLPDQ